MKILNAITSDNPTTVDELWKITHHTYFHAIKFKLLARSGTSDDYYLLHDCKSKADLIDYIDNNFKEPIGDEYAIEIIWKCKYGD
jgi:hypothetical protein